MRLLVIWVILLPLNLIGQLPVALPEIVNFDKHDYRAGSQNWALIQDSNRFIYAGNNEGLLTFDGTYWRKYNLPNNTIVRSLALHNRRIYAGGQDEFGYFTPLKNGKLSYQSLKSLIREESRNFSDVWFTETLEDEIFFMANHHIFQYNGKSVREYLSDNNYIWTFLGRFNGKLIAQNSRPEVFEYNNGEWKNIPELNNLPSGFLITGITGFGKDSAIITTEKHGVLIWTDKKLIPFAIQHHLHHEPAYSGVVRIDEERFALSSFSNGCLIIDKRGRLLEHYHNKTHIQNNNIRSILVDKNKNLWLALDTGIDFIAFDNAVKHMLPEEFLGSAGYSSLLVKDKLYLGLSNGVYVAKLPDGTTDLGDQKFSFTFIPGSEGQVWNLSEIEGRIFLGKHDGLYEIINDKVFPIDKSVGYWLFGEFQKNDSLRYIIAGSYNGVKILKQKEIPVPVCTTYNESSRFLAVDKNSIWSSHPYRGIFRIIMGVNGAPKVKLYTSKSGLPSTMNNYVYNIKGRLAVATERGIYEYDHVTDQFKPSSYYKDIFGDMSLSYLKEDARGNIWFIHKKTLGVVDFSEEKPEIIYFTELNDKTVTGFEHVNPINQQNILIGSEKGFYLINYNKYKRNNNDLKVFIRSALSYGKKDSLLSGGEKIKHGSNSIRFEFSSPLFEQQSNIEYSFMLEGFDKKWSPWSDRTERDYANLRYGKYVFKVKARNNLGNESPVEQFEFTIAPPWYLSTFAYIAYFILSVLFAYLIKIRVDRRLKKQQQKHKEEQERLKRLHQLEMEKSEKEIVKLRNEKLESEIEFKNQQLAASAMHVVQKGELLKKIKAELQKLVKNNKKEEDVDGLKRIMKLLAEEERMNEDWEQFSVHFNKVHGDFLIALKEKYPQLSAHELKLCAYLRMNLASKEIAQLMNISVRGVEISRYRLRKKLNIPTEVNLFEFMLELQKKN